MGVRNPYKTSKRSAGGLVTSTLLVSGVVLLALTGRGYHRRRTARSIRGGIVPKSNQKTSNTAPGKQPNEAVDVTKNASAKSSSWSAVDHVADHFGAAAEDAGGWMRGHAENFLGKEMVNALGGFVEAGLDQVGELTEQFEDFLGDDEDDGDFDFDEERDPEPGDGVHPAVEEMDDTKEIDESAKKIEGGKEVTVTQEEEKPKENTSESGQAESGKKEKEQQPPPVVVTQGEEKQLPQDAAVVEQSPGTGQETTAAPIVEPPKPEQAVAAAA